MIDLGKTWLEEGKQLLLARAQLAQEAADHATGPYRDVMEASANAWRRAWIAFEDAWRATLAPATRPVPWTDTTLRQGNTLLSVKVWDGVPDAARRDVEALARDLVDRLSSSGMDVHIECYPLREETRNVLEKAP